MSTETPSPGAAPLAPAVLTPAAARALAARVPGPVVRGLVPALCAGLLASYLVAMASTGMPVDALTPAYQLSCVAFGVLLSTTVLVLATGRGASVAALVGAALAVTAPGGPTPVGLVLAAMLAGVAGCLALVRARRRTGLPAAGAGPAVDVPIGQVVARGWLARSRGAAVFAVVGAVLALGGLGLWVHDSRSAAAFRARSVVGTGTVTAVDDDAFTATVTLADGGGTLTVPLENLEPEVGDVVEVRHDAGGRSELVADVFDPNGALVLVGAGVAGGAGAALVARDRRRRRGRALHGVPVVAAATWDRARATVLVRSATGAVTAVLLDELVPADDAGHRRRLAGPDLARRLDDGAGRPDDGCPQDDEPGTRPGDLRSGVDALTDDELLRLAREQTLADRADDADEDGAADGVAFDLPAVGDHASPLAYRLWTDVPVRAVGLADRDGALALQDPDGRWWLAWTTRRPAPSEAPTHPVADDATHPVTDDATGPAATTSAAATAEPGTRGGSPAGAPVRRARAGETSGWYRFWAAAEDRATRVLRPFARATGRWLPWPAAIGAALLARWVLGGDDGPGWWHLVLVTLGAATLGAAWVRAATPALRVDAAGLQLEGTVRYERVPWAAVLAVLADDVNVVVRVTTPDGEQDALVLPDPAPRDYLPGVRGPARAAAAVGQARLEAAAGRLPHRVRLPVTPGAASWLWWFVCVGAGGLAGLLGR